MRVLTAKLVTEREILVGVPDDLIVETVDNRTYIVEPGTGITGPKIMLDPTVALKRGLLVELTERSQ